MRLVEERDKWSEMFKQGYEPSGVLTDYRNNRDSESWRSSRSVEELCEYILYLESLL